MNKEYIKELTFTIIGSAIEVHKELGPGLLESVYHKCLKQEFRLRGLSFRSEFLVPVNYKGLDVCAELRCDLLVDDWIVLELKSVEYMIPIHQAQILTYMKLLEKPKGILINFNCGNLFKEGQQTFVNNYFAELPEY